MGGPPAAVTRQALGHYSLESGGGGGRGENNQEERFDGRDAGDTYGEPILEATHPSLTLTPGRCCGEPVLACAGLQQSAGSVAFVIPPSCSGSLAYKTKA